MYKGASRQGTHCMRLVITADVLVIFNKSPANIISGIVICRKSYYKSSSVCLFVCLSVCLFVCLSVCSLSPPRSFDRSSPNLVGVCRWTSELPLRGSFSKRSTARRVNGSLSLSTILYMHQPHATRCNGSSCLQLQSLIRHLLLDGYRTASQQCI